MKQVIKAEFRKLFTVRSTYILSGLALALVIFVAFYIEGYKSSGPFNNPTILALASSNAIGIISGIIAIISVLLVTHEYRYNTIVYTLTYARRRLNVLIAKAFVLSVFALLFGLFVSILAPFLTAVALQIRGVELTHQVFSPLDLLWRNLFTVWGFSMIAFVLSVLIRSQVVAIIALFIIPNPIEPLLGVVLKERAAYLPFNALFSVLSDGRISHLAGAVSVVIWLLVGFIISWQLFLRRDTN